MNVIDVSTISDSERRVIVLDDLVQKFVGPISEARERFPDAFSDSPAEPFPAAEQALHELSLSPAHPASL